MNFKIKEKDTGKTYSNCEDVQLRHGHEETLHLKSHGTTGPSNCSGESAAAQVKGLEGDKMGTSQNSPTKENIRSEFQEQEDSKLEDIQNKETGRVAVEEYNEDEGNKSQRSDSPVNEGAGNISTDDTGYVSDMSMNSSSCFKEADRSHDSDVVTGTDASSRQSTPDKSAKERKNSEIDTPELDSTVSNREGGVKSRISCDSGIVDDSLLSPRSEKDLSPVEFNAAAEQKRKNSEIDTPELDSTVSNREGGVKSRISCDSGIVDDSLLSPRSEKDLSPVKFNSAAEQKVLHDVYLHIHIGQTIQCSQRDENTIKYQQEIIHEVGENQLRAAVANEMPAQIPERIKLVSKFTCKRCFKRPAERLPVTCSHFSLCAECANDTNVCPFPKCQKTFDRTYPATF